MLNNFSFCEKQIKCSAKDVFNFSSILVEIQKITIKLSPHSNRSVKMATTPKTPATAAEVNSKPTSGTVNDLDKAIADVLSEIKGLDKGIKKLNERRVILTARYEQLSEKRQMYASEAIATEQNWQSGESNEGI